MRESPQGSDSIINFLQRLGQPTRSRPTAQKHRRFIAIRTPVASSPATFLIALVSALATALVAAADTRPRISYDRDIRPILSDKCYRCHGPDAEAREAELRLDTREGLSAKVVIASKPDKSELIARIFSDDEDVRMPPPESKLSLSNDQKELLRRWVAEGATFAEHWAFVPLPDKVEVT